MNKNQRLQQVWKQFEEEHGFPGTTREAITWGYRKGLLELPEIDPFDVLAEEMAKALREEYATDNKGRRYRVNHAVRVSKGGVQYTFWASMGMANRPHMQRSFALRRKSIVSDCVQLKTDVDAYNDMSQDEKPIQLVLDFTRDVAEHVAVH